MSSSPLLLFLLLLLLSLSTATSGMKQSELDSLLAALHSRGYTRFSNAIATSDILYDVLSSHSSAFTFFAPPDPPLFSLDMADSGEDYTNTLRCHVISSRLTTNQLRRGSTPSGSTLDTLVKGKRIRVQLRRRAVGDDVITVNGVLVSLPGLFYSRNVAVHGLAGILNFTTPTPPAVVRRRHPPLAPPHRPSPDSAANHSNQFHAPANQSDASLPLNQTNVANISDVFQNNTIESVVSDPGYSQHSLPMIAPPPGYAAAQPEVTEMSDGYSYGGEEIKASVTGLDDDAATESRSVDDVTEKFRRIDGADMAVVSPESFAGVMEMLQADFEKWDQRIFDCLLTDDFGHVSTAPGYLYTRQQPHTSMPSSCAGLHQFLHLEHLNP